jgi:hypothetical protein
MDMDMDRIVFEFQTKHGVFRDALYLPADHGLSEAQIEALKQERLNNWLVVVENPPPPAPETVELDGVTYERVTVNGQVVLKPVQV